MSRSNDQQLLDRAFDELERESPDRLRRMLHWLRDPNSRWVRIPLGVLFIVAGFLWFLPVVGIEMLPIGLLLIAQDVPFLKRPVGKMMLWLERKWVDFRRRRRSKHSK
jgi:membrane-bound ClpP family serine protease